jgi:hypothetical protein
VNDPPNVRAVSPSRRLWVLGVAIIGLLGIHVVLTVVHYSSMEIPWLVRQIWDVDEEESYPTWYSSALLGVTAFFLGLHTMTCRRRGDASWGAWWGLAAGFLALSIEEVAGLHETINSSIEISWVGPALVVVALCVGLYVQFLLALPAATRRAVYHRWCRIYRRVARGGEGDRFLCGERSAGHAGLQFVDGGRRGYGDVWGVAVFTSVTSLYGRRRTPVAGGNCAGGARAPKPSVRATWWGIGVRGAGLGAPGGGITCCWGGRRRRRRWRGWLWRRSLRWRG